MLSKRLKSCGRFLCCVLPIIAIATARAAINGTSSIEWRVCEAKIVAVGRIAKVNTTIWNSVRYEDCVLEVIENIKGSALTQIPFTFRHVTDDQEKWNYPKGEVLVFLSVWKDRYSDEQVSSGQFANPYYETRMHKRFVPAGRGDRPERYSIIPLPNPIEDLYDREMNPVKNKDDLLAICRAWAASPITYPISVDVPFGTPLHRQYYGRSAVFFLVPAEEKFRSRYLKYAKSSNEGERYLAAANLWKFPGDDTEAALRSLLDDAIESVWINTPDSIAEIEYRIRSNACHGLKRIGKSVPGDLVLRRKPTETEQRKYRIQHWENRFNRVTQDGLTIKSIEVSEVRTPAGEQESASILVELSTGASGFSVVVVPYVWKLGEMANAQFIGFDSDLRQSDTRAFFVKGSPSKEQIDHLQKKLGLRADSR